MSATWQSRHPNENAPDVEIEADRPPFSLHSTHEFSPTSSYSDARKSSPLPPEKGVAAEHSQEEA